MIHAFVMNAVVMFHTVVMIHTVVSVVVVRTVVLRHESASHDSYPCDDLCACQ